MLSNDRTVWCDRCCCSILEGLRAGKMLCRLSNLPVVVHHNAGTPVTFGSGPQSPLPASACRDEYADADRRLQDGSYVQFTPS